MAEFHDIEYHGIGADQDIDIRSERCFRDHSPGDSVISLDQDEHSEFKAPVPAFNHLYQSSLGWNKFSTILEQKLPIPIPEQAFRDKLAKNKTSSANAALSSRALKRWKSLNSGIKPIERYRQETEPCEQFLLGMGLQRSATPEDVPLFDLQSSLPVKSRLEDLDHAQCNSTCCSLPPLSTHYPQVNRVHQSWPRPGVQLSLNLEYVPIPSADTTNLKGLSDMLHALEGEQWLNMSPEERVQHAHHIAFTKRRMRGEESPREHRLPKFRKRAWSVDKKGD